MLVKGLIGGFLSAALFAGGAYLVWDYKSLLTEKGAWSTKVKQAEQAFEEQKLIPGRVMFLNDPGARVPLIMKGAVAFALNLQCKQYKWCVQNNVITLPIEPRMYRTHSLVTSAEREPSLAVCAFQEIMRLHLFKQLSDTPKSQRD